MKFCLMAFFLMLGLPNFVLAAQQGVITAEKGVVYKKSSPSSKVLGKIRRGKKVILSTKSKNGFYKIKVGKKKYGWISVDEVLVRKKEKKKTESGDKFGKRFMIGAFGGVVLVDFKTGTNNVHNFLELQDTTEMDPYAYLAGGQVSFEVLSWLNIVARAELLWTSIIVANDSDSEKLPIEIKSLPIMAGLEYRYALTEQFSVMLNAMAGVGLNTGLVGAAPSADGLFTSDSEKIEYLDNPITYQGAVGMRFNIVEAVSIFGYGGYRILKTKVITDPVYNSSAESEFSFFKTDGSFKSLEADLSGAFGFVGMGVHF